MNMCTFRSDLIAYFVFVNGWSFKKEKHSFCFVNFFPSKVLWESVGGKNGAKKKFQFSVAGQNL